LLELLNKTSEFTADIAFQMEAFMKEHSEQICQMEKANFYGPMESNIQDTGDKVCRKDKESRPSQTENRCEEFGREEIG
jgi:hypothetical protein